MNEKVVRTLCSGCHAQCGVLVHVEHGTVTKIEGDPNHPQSRGYSCIKGRVQQEWLYHPDRLKYPLKRIGEKAGGKWQRITWEQALNEITAKFTDIREKHTADSIAILHGTGPRPSIMATQRLAYAMGSPNIISTDLHICMAPSVIGDSFTTGTSLMQEKGPDYLSSKCIIVFGANPLVSHAHRGNDIVEAHRKHGAKLIVVDPRRTPLAGRADLWLQIRPGTDVALVLGMINVIISENLFDNEFVNNWCHGFDKLKERASEYSLERVAEITWIPTDKIRQAARMYAANKPASLHQRVAIEHNINSMQTIRALASLIAITGNIDIKGGNLLSPPFNLPRPSPEIEEKRIGSKEHPLASSRESPSPFVHCALAAEAMLSGQLKALYCAGGNPIVNMQNVKKMWQAFKKLELLVVADFFMTPTAELADYVLPAAHWLERDEFVPHETCVAARQKVVGPLFECRDDRDIVIELAKHMPWAERQFLPWDNAREWDESTMKRFGISFDEFKEKGYILSPVEYKKYEKQGFHTPTGKVELYSTVFEKHGYNPLPLYVEPPQSPVSSPELMKDYPYILISGSRTVEYFHSMGRQIKSLRRRYPDPFIEIHPDVARKTNVNDGDWVWVETPQVIGERVKLKVKITDYIDPRIVHTSYGWWFPEKPGPEHGCFDSNISVVLSDGHREPIVGAVSMNGTLCRFYKEEK